MKKKIKAHQIGTTNKSNLPFEDLQKICANTGCGDFHGQNWAPSPHRLKKKATIGANKTAVEKAARDAAPPFVPLPEWEKEKEKNQKWERLGHFTLASIDWTIGCRNAAIGFQFSLDLCVWVIRKGLRTWSLGWVATHELTVHVKIRLSSLAPQNVRSSASDLTVSSL